MARLIDVDTIYTDGQHNAFTDLLKWKDHYYLSFRTAETHCAPPNGDVIVLRSPDLKEWETCARIDTGADDRDPKLIDAGDRLGMVFGTWYTRWGDGTHSIINEQLDLISHVTLSENGRTWSVPQQVYGVNYWLWRVLPTDEGYFCAAYHFGRRSDRLMRTVNLLRSDDLIDWRLCCQMRAGGGSGEPVLYRPARGVLNCVIRAIEPDNHSWLGQSKAPYTEWTWTDLGVMIHAPVVLCVNDEWIVAGRSQSCDLPEGTYDPKYGSNTSVWAIRNSKAEHLLTVPSCGDCSYPGLAFGPNGEIAMSYYSQHEHLPLPETPPNPADIFLARFNR